MGRKPSVNAPCPCGSGLKYKRCCRILHKGAPAQSPEALMRARFSAYALGEVRFLMETTHPRGPHHQTDAEAWAGSLRAYCRSVRFTGLKVLEVEGGGPEEGQGWVRFHASLEQGDQDLSFTERSLFLRDRGRWRYHSGEMGG